MKTALLKLIPSFLLAACVAILLRFEPFSTSDSAYVLEMHLSANVTCEMHLMFDFGNGFRRESTRDFWALESAQPRVYRMALPRAVIRRFSMVSTDDSARVAVSEIRIMDSDGGVVTSSNTGDPTPKASVVIGLAKPLSTIPPEDESWFWTGIQFVAAAAVFALLSHFLERRSPSWKEHCRAAWGKAWKWSLTHPTASIFSVAVMAVVLSCHPVIFFGKSFASPNNGVLCLYDSFPTIPGVRDSPVETWNSSDVRALVEAHIPYSVAQHRSIFRDHELPLWLRGDMCGLTLLGQGQSMIADPLHWLPILANGAAWAWDAKFILAKILFCFGIGLVVCTSTRHLPTAMLLAFSSAFIGFFSYRFTHAAFFGLSYSPWILLCWLRAAGASSSRRAAIWALASIVADMMELNSGTGKESSMLLICINAAGALILLLHGAPWRERLRNFAVMAAGGVLFAALSAPLWLVFFDSLSASATLYDVPTVNQMQPGIFLGLFDELFYRELMPAEWQIDPSVNFLVLIGVLWAFADFDRLRRDRVFLGAFLAALPLVALIFGMVPPQWVMKIPLIGNVWHVDNTFSCPLFILFFVLAGFGIRNCAVKIGSDMEWKADWKRTLIFAGILAAAYFGSANARARWPSYGVQALRTFEPSPFFIGYSLALFAAVAVLPVVMRRLALGRGSIVVLGTVAAASLFIVHFRHGMWLETKFDYYVMNPRERMDLQARSAAVDYVLNHQNEPSRVASLGQVLRPGFNSVYGLETGTGADAVANRWYGEWLDAAGFSRSWMWTVEVPGNDPRKAAPFYDAMNIRYFLRSNAMHEPAPPGLKKALKADLEVYESPTVWPRAFFTNRVSAYAKPEELADLIERGDGRPLAGMQDPPPAVAALGADQATRQVAPATGYRLTSNATTFQLDATGPGLAVLTEAWEKGSFQVSVNGLPTQCLRVNHAFKGVLIPSAGHFTITFRYWPRLLTPALWAASLALAVLAGWLIALFRWAAVGWTND